MVLFAGRKLVHKPQLRGLLAHFSQWRPTKTCKALEDEAALLALCRTLVVEAGFREDAVLEEVFAWQDDDEPLPPAAALAALLPATGHVFTRDGGVQCVDALRTVLYHLACDHTSDTVLVGAEHACQLLHRVVLGNFPDRLEEVLSVEEVLVLKMDAGELLELMLQMAPMVQAEPVVHGALVEVLCHLVRMYASVVCISLAESSASLPGLSGLGDETAAISSYESWPVLPVSCFCG